ncbi:hypothetical protein HMN09_00302000 [Mycena chlorophos]|uniref:Uncharacterized protein n=1 Tax=Mycena chlorophos TaxID=658473 RepID=A0A8H6TMY0_MYCCL|nr:hypothetical protein HMN09_00302000 [Mycena chlorophos]
MDALFAHIPHLRRIFTRGTSVFPTCTFNFGPQTVTVPHLDLLNLAWGWCFITALGDFDPTKGGHLILWDLKRFIRFPPGATIAIPSALLRHSNVAIQQTETRYSFTHRSKVKRLSKAERDAFVQAQAARFSEGLKIFKELFRFKLRQASFGRALMRYSKPVIRDLQRRELQRAAWFRLGETLMSTQAHSPLVMTRVVGNDTNVLFLINGPEIKTVSSLINGPEVRTSSSFLINGPETTNAFSFLINTPGNGTVRVAGRTEVDETGAFFFLINGPETRTSPSFLINGPETANTFSFLINGPEIMGKISEGSLKEHIEFPVDDSFTLSKRTFAGHRRPIRVEDPPPDDDLYARRGPAARRRRIRVEDPPPDDDLYGVEDPPPDDDLYA